MKVAVLYVQPGQTNIKDIFKNEIPKNSRFLSFMDDIPRGFL